MRSENKDVGDAIEARSSSVAADDDDNVLPVNTALRRHKCMSTAQAMNENGRNIYWRLCECVPRLRQCSVIKKQFLPVLHGWIFVFLFSPSLTCQTFESTVCIVYIMVYWLFSGDIMIKCAIGAESIYEERHAALNRRRNRWTVWRCDWVRRKGRHDTRQCIWQMSRHNSRRNSVEQRNLYDCMMFSCHRLF